MLLSFFILYHEDVSYMLLYFFVSVKANCCWEKKVEGELVLFGSHVDDGANDFGMHHLVSGTCIQHFLLNM